MSTYYPMTVKEAMEKIASNKFVLPAIQRQFVWRPEQIEMLFDSIIRNYPINSFMLWQITDPNIQQNYKFYSFICDYIDKFAEDNPEAPVKMLPLPFDAVIDGQQRLTSLYIGLNGTYRYKKPNKWWPKTATEEAMPTRKLYLDLAKPVDSSIDNEKRYDLRFLSNEDLKNDADGAHYWFRVGEITDPRTFREENDVFKYLFAHGLGGNEFAQETLIRLFTKINKDELINFYQEKEQDQDKVLDVFLRTNSGGTPLSFSDLLMSIASANWTKFDAREEMKKVKDEVYTFGNPGFDISQDLILKSLLVLSDVDVRFKIQNFGRDNVSVFEEKWLDVRNALVSTFHLLEDLGFNDSLLRAKNAIIPIAYYIYKNGLSESIVKDNYPAEDKERIAKWLSLSLLKGIFGGTSDSILRSIREILKTKSKPMYFPLDEIIAGFKGNTDKNYSFDDDIINGFLTEQYQSINGSLVLYLLYPEVVLRHGKNIAQDHMHPKTLFQDADKFAQIGFPPDQQDFCRNPENWNSVLNLQLLSEIENKSKGTALLKDWATEQKRTADDLNVPEGTSLETIDFQKFILERKKILFQKLKNALS
ncbi:MAG: DUF262 domain-containing protein [Bacilli bacterium]|jgi:uncharacterized protein with ParB-like and HNH nuclease domain|nr:DUF262 domain-containing protein [Bacilli bacterium]